MSDSENNYLESEEDFPPADGGMLLEEDEQVKFDAGETVPFTIDSALLAAFQEIDGDTFETKVYSVNAPKVIKANKFLVGKSKFFVNSEVEATDELENIQKEWESTNLSGKNLIDLQTTDVVDVSKKNKAAFILSLHKAIKEIKDFLVNETAPTQFAINSAFDQSTQILETILGTKVNTSSKHLEAMISDAIRLKTFDFIAQKLNLSKEQKAIIVNKYFVITVPTLNKIHNVE